MSRTDEEREQIVIKISLIGTLTTALLGVVFFFILNSQAVLLDSLFSLTNVLLGFLTIWVIKISKSKPTKRFHYGLVQARPLMQLFKSLIFTGFLLTSFIESFMALLSGGRDIAGDLVFYYTIVTVIISLIFIIVMKRLKGDKPSTIVQLEIQGWIQDILITLAIGMGFAISTWVKLPIINSLKPYIDSVLVLIIVLFFIPSIVKMLISSGKELLLAAPHMETQEKINELIEKVCKKYELSIKSLSLIKLDLELYIDIEFYINVTEKVDWLTINKIRKEVADLVKSKNKNTELYISFYPKVND